MVDEMTSHVTMERKRRSRFDVPPESSFSPSLPTNSFCDVEQGSGDSTSHAHRVPSLQEQTLVALQRQLEYLPQYIPVEDARYRQRLKDALQKNFDYIYRKDMFPEQFLQAKSSGNLLARSGVEAELLLNGRHLGSSGIGSAPMVAVPRSIENNRVYVSGFPADITEEEIEILFSSAGKVKKIKLYVDGEGRNKGDALVTYTSSESATIAAVKLNRLDIGDGCVISVAAAEYKQDVQSNTRDKADEARTIHFQPSGSLLQSVSVEDRDESVADLLKSLEASSVPMVEPLGEIDSKKGLRGRLPIEVGFGEFPVLILRHAYDLNRTTSTNYKDDYLSEVQTDLMLECCKFGKIKSVFLPITDSSSSWFHGCAFITFHKESDAIDCANYLHNRSFEGRRLKGYICCSQSAAASNEVQNVAESKLDDSAALHNIEVDVENFLNTLL